MAERKRSDQTRDKNRESIDNQIIYSQLIPYLQHFDPYTFGKLDEFDEEILNRLANKKCDAILERAKYRVSSAIDDILVDLNELLPIHSKLESAMRKSLQYTEDLREDISLSENEYDEKFKLSEVYYRTLTRIGGEVDTIIAIIYKSILDNFPNAEWTYESFLTAKEYITPFDGEYRSRLLKVNIKNGAGNLSASTEGGDNDAAIDVLLKEASAKCLALIHVLRMEFGLFGKLQSNDGWWSRAYIKEEIATKEYKTEKLEGFGKTLVQYLNAGIGDRESVSEIYQQMSDKDKKTFIDLIKKYNLKQFTWNWF